MTFMQAQTDAKNEGREEGREEGILETLKTSISAMRSLRLSDEEIAKLLNIPLSQVLAITEAEPVSDKRRNNMIPGDLSLEDLLPEDLILEDLSPEDLIPKELPPELEAKHQAFRELFHEGLRDSFMDSYREGYAIGYKEGYVKGYREGYVEGCRETISLLRSRSLPDEKIAELLKIPLSLVQFVTETKPVSD